ncbi:hypothetical protein TorRG33x02_082580 [Trema orientale]|uniref:Uncharacterized protein n=1 Tax=Trema orientale TaxID=63057 RepID=A0A2P5FDY8_TREOI|nr:hypothetical protein TorRG33x02_082580 [Trema orientale]
MMLIHISKAHSNNLLSIELDESRAAWFRIRVVLEEFHQRARGSGQHQESYPKIQTTSRSRKSSGQRGLIQMEKKRKEGILTRLYPLELGLDHALVRNPPFKIAHTL